MTLLPPRLAAPAVLDGQVIAHIVFDLTFYLGSASEADLDFLVNLYRAVCPEDRFVFYATPETLDWDRIDDPLLTKQGHLAWQRGEPLPFLAPVRTRLSTQRPFFIMFWDGQDRDMYCFSYRQVRDAERKPHTFVRFTLPVSLDPSTLVLLARRIGDRLLFASGHAGLQFGYAPSFKHEAFTHIYPLARRYWAIDIEDLNGTLPLMQQHIKGISWLTLLGPKYLESDALGAASAVCDIDPLLRRERLKGGVLFQVGDAPVPGDRHRASPELETMTRLGTALRELIVTEHPEFGGDGFASHGDTMGWLHRFDDADGWS